MDEEIHDRVTNEFLDETFTKVKLSDAIVNMDNDFKINRKVSFNCDVYALHNASGMRPSDHFFAMLGERVFRIITSKDGALFNPSTLAAVRSRRADVLEHNDTR